MRGQRNGKHTPYRSFDKADFLLLCVRAKPIFFFTVFPDFSSSLPPSIIRYLMADLKCCVSTLLFAALLDFVAINEM